MKKEESDTWAMDQIWTSILEYELNNPNLVESLQNFVNYPSEFNRDIFLKMAWIQVDWDLLKAIEDIVFTDTTPWEDSSVTETEPTTSPGTETEPTSSPGKETEPTSSPGTDEEWEDTGAVNPAVDYEWDSSPVKTNTQEEINIRLWHKPHPDDMWKVAPPWPFETDLKFGIGDGRL